MIYGLYNSAAGMLVNQYRQDVIANNLANAETTGFKRDVAAFAERIPASRAGVRSGASDELLRDMTGGVWLAQTVTDHSEGPKQPSDNPLDIALEGPGFLAVQVDGQPQYTRDGRMLVDAYGRLVAATDSAPILARGGIPIRVNPHGGQVTVDTDGQLLQDGRPVAELELVDFPNYDALVKRGTNRFAAPEGAAQPTRPYVHGGYTEASGVEPVKELVNMMEAARAYQMNAQMVTLQDQTLARLIRVVGT
jgi:flagellar basal-body rod protein FlgF